MPPIKPHLKPVLLLLALPVLLSACAHDSPLSRPVPGPLIPQLPQQARQTESAKHSASASSNIDRWLPAPTEPSSPARPAKLHTTH